MPPEFESIDWTIDERRGLALLLQGTDSRAKAFYGMDPERASRSVLLGSCTSNPLTRQACAWAGHIDLATLDEAHVQQQVAHMFGAERAMLCASGTDLEALASLCMGETAFFTLAIDRNEVGSGCRSAAQGLPHAPGGAITAPLGLEVELAELMLRDALGAAISPEALDATFLQLASQANGRPAILRLCACSKTGLQGPSEAAMAQALQENPQARCLVDACQGRFTRDEVGHWLARGWAVMVTGSKRHGAPPFCAALLLGSQHDVWWPQHRHARLGDHLNERHPGLTTRWQMALEATARANGIWWMPADETRAWKGLCTRFLSALPQGLVQRSEERQGILSLDLGWNLTQTRHLWSGLAERGFFVGQPVSTGPTAHLRVACSLGTDPLRLPNMMQALATALHELSAEIRAVSP
jgi:hypothetical protein